jgi:hypothetical protein
VVKEARGLVVATVHCRDDLQKSASSPSDEARRIAEAIARVLEFVMGR